MNDKIKINLQMAGASYPLTINREDEEMVREAAKQVDIRLNAYREHYQNVSLERIIAMVAYQFALENLQLKDRNDTEPYTAKITDRGIGDLFQGTISYNPSVGSVKERNSRTVQKFALHQSKLLCSAFLFIH